MQKALKNENYKKIWEAVIKNRHPNAKSLEEALDMESKKNDCLFNTELFSETYLDNKQMRVIEIMAAKCNGEIDDYCERTCEAFDANRFSSFMEEISTPTMTLGRPITLEDIGNVFESLSNNRDIFNNEKYAPHLYIKIGGSYAHCGFNFPIDNAIFNIHFLWQLTKPLHEQTPETWEKIASLITI